MSIDRPKTIEELRAAFEDQVKRANQMKGLEGMRLRGGIQKGAAEKARRRLIEDMEQHQV